MNCIVYAKPVRGCVVAHLSPGGMLPAEIGTDQETGEPVEITPAETEAEFVARMIGLLVPQGAAHVTLDPADLPSSSPDDWTITNGQIVELTPLPKFLPLSPVQIRLGLLAGGITPEQVSTAIDAITDPVQRATARTYWDYSLSYRRTHPLVATLAAAFSLSESQVDAMWLAAMEME